MDLLLAIRVAEPWTPASVAVLVVLGLLIVGLTLWVIARH